MVASKIYMDMLSSCYDSMTDREAEKYNEMTEYELGRVDCSGSRWKRVMPIDVTRYMSWRDPKELEGTVHQVVLSNALKVSLMQGSRNDD